MKNASSSDQVNALLGRAWHTVWMHDWKLIVGVGVLLALEAAWVGWHGAAPARRRSHRL